MAKVIVHHEPHPEDNAALQAWYSRSNKSVVEHREKLAREGSGKFMDQIFIQYGHASVGDLGTTTVYFEGISMLAAKAIEDNPLFNGQECSSRYIDMGAVEMKVPVNLAKDDPEAIQVRDYMEKLRLFYTTSLPVVTEHLHRTHPKQEGQSEVRYSKAISARAYDILRGFLPCGTTTNVAWSGTLRNFKENLERMVFHPLEEVELLAVEALRQLQEKYPNSFEKSDPYDNPHAAYLKTPEHFYSGLDIYWGESPDIEEIYCYELDQSLVCAPSNTALMCGGYPFNHKSYITEADKVGATQHPRGYMLPRHGLVSPDSVTVYGEIDFGSFRDLQRHRGGYCSMPVVGPWMGFHEWYVDNLPETLQESARDLVKQGFLLAGDLSKGLSGAASYRQGVRNQYFMPMGTLVEFCLEYNIRQATYVAELRSGQTVHPTLRRVAQDIGEVLCRSGYVVHYNLEEDEWSIRRGGQDIVERNPD